MTKLCKFTYNKDRVPAELNASDFTLETTGTRDAVFIRGPKKDIEKRQATLQLAICVQPGKQNGKPTLILRNANPEDDRYEFLCFFCQNSTNLTVFAKKRC